MKNKQGILGQLRAFLVASLALWCAIGLQSALAAEAIKLGATASLSGVYAGPGQDQLEGIKMWVHDINARGALLGRKVELIYYDDESDADTVRRLYQRLINDDKVDLLIGPYSSDLTLVASDVTEQHDFPMVAAGAAASEIWSRGYRNIFQVDAPAYEYMDLLIKSAKNNAGLTRIALIYPAADFSREVAEGVRAKAAEQGMEIVFDEEYPLDSTDFSDLVRRMRLSAPELVIGATYLNDSIALVREAKRQQLSPKAFAFTVGPALTEFGEALGDDADGIIGVVSWMRGGRVPMAYDFSFRFKEQFGRNAGA
ncbi:MAG: amino acid ABC transporter substrate-binding protein, partial [Thiogranum sp.]